MVSIFLCGLGGSGKSALVKTLRERKEFKLLHAILDVPKDVMRELGIQHGDELKDKDVMYDLQMGIIQEQCNREEKFFESACDSNHNTASETLIYKREKDSSFQNGCISDHSVLDNLVYTSYFLSEKVSRNLVNEYAEIERAIARYQSSLVVLLSPKPKGEHDSTRIKITGGEREEFENLYRSTLRDHNIPFLDLSFSSHENRVNAIRKALAGKMPLQTSTLSHYGRKPQDRDAEGGSTNFSFFKQSPKERICASIKTINLKEHEYEQTWTSFQSGQTNRFVHGKPKEVTDKLALLSFHINMRSTEVQKMLKNGITINGEVYKFLGCSSSGLKNRKCYMWRGSQAEVDEMLEEFKSITSVSKRMARIGLLFSAVNMTSIKVTERDVVFEDDILSTCGRHNFSDGCGGISIQLAQEVFNEVNDSFHEETYLPAVYQIRYQGYKGVLALDPTLTGLTIKVRPSMKKFETDSYPFIGVCNHSRAYTFGHLNKQFIMLLSGLGVPDEVFEEKQRCHLHLIQKMVCDRQAAIMVLQWQNKFDVAQLIVKLPREIPFRHQMNDHQNQYLLKCIHEVQQKLVAKVEKLSILIPESRTLFGVCDPFGVLDYGECFVRLTSSDEPKTIRGQVVVCKNPCYLLGDVRVLRAVNCADKPQTDELSHLVDCIVFPSRGKRPHSDEIAGSDLDGDEYFVTWDKNLIPPSTRKPYDYPGAESKGEGIITTDKILRYFSIRNETQKLTGRIDKYFNKWADINGVSSIQCERLGMLFSRVIDASKTGETICIPTGLVPATDDNVDAGCRYVWKKMANTAYQFQQKFKEKIANNEEDCMKIDHISDSFALDVVQIVSSNVSEFAKFQFSWNFTKLLNEDAEAKEVAAMTLEKYADYINFSLFTIEEKKEAVDAGVPMAMIANALNKSKLLTVDELATLHMHTSSSPWNLYFAKNHEEFNWMYLFKALTTHDKVLLVIRIPDEVTIVLQFLEKCKEGEEQEVRPGTISALFFSKHFGFQAQRYILGPKYVLDLMPTKVQLYREKKKNLTFVWLKDCETKNTSRKDTNVISDEIINCISVDLTRFDRRVNNRGQIRHPLVNKTPFVSVEVYVQNDNNDILYFDTEEVNELPTVENAEDSETEAEDADRQIDFASMLALTTTDAETELLSDDKFLSALQKAAAEVRVADFLAILSKWTQTGVAADITEEALLLLETTVQKVTPVTPTEELRTSLEELLVIIRDSLYKPVVTAAVIGHLTRLNLEDAAFQIVQSNLDISCTGIMDFLSILENWSVWWFVQSKAAKTFVANVSTLILSKLPAQDTADLPARIARYTLHFGHLQFLALSEEMDIIKEAYKTNDGTLSKMKVDSTAEKDPETVTFYRTSALSHRPQITSGQFVSITREIDFKENPGIKSCCCVAQVQNFRLAPLTITLKVIGKIPDLLADCLTDDKVRYWRIDVIANITTYSRVLNALKALVSPEPTVSTDLLILLTHPGGQTRESSLFQDIPLHDLDKGDARLLLDHCGLNAKQEEAVQSAIEQKVTLIQGPPGTGKTRVACNIVRQAHDLKKFNGILVVAETNIAVDNIAHKLKEGLIILRLGAEEGIDRSLYEHTLEGQLKKMEESEAKKTSFQDMKGVAHRKARLVKKILKSADVILTTCAGAGDLTLKESTFELVIVDEATQTMETTLLCSLVHGAKQLVMIGDPKQLGPFSIRPLSSEDNEGLPGVGLLSTTFFHRLFAVMPSIMLDTQHRMHQELAKFPSDHFYDGQLRSNVDPQPVVFPWPVPKRPLCFIHVKSRERKYGTSFCNYEEIRIVQKVLDKLLNIAEDEYDKRRLTIDNIAILTLYKGQVIELRNRIKPKIEVNSIDGFQGREKEIIIVSTVRANDKSTLGFSDDRNRLNVLLTRAKWGLVVVGNEDTLNSSELWAKWLQDAPRLVDDQLNQTTDVDARSKRTPTTQRWLDPRQMAAGNRSYQQRGRGSNRRGHGVSMQGRNKSMARPHTGPNR